MASSVEFAPGKRIVVSSVVGDGVLEVRGVGVFAENKIFFSNFIKTFFLKSF